MRQKYLTFKSIIILLKKVFKQKETGTFFIVTESNQSARLTFDQGEIISIYCFNKFGEDAIGLMSNINSGICRFRRGNISIRRENLPKTSDILQLLENFSQGIHTNTTEAIAKKSNTISLSQKLVFENCLEEYIGPMAPIICEEYLSIDNDLHSILESLESVVRKISGQKNAIKFKEAAVMQLKK